MRRGRAAASQLDIIWRNCTQLWTRLDAAHGGRSCGGCKRHLLFVFIKSVREGGKDEKRGKEQEGKSSKKGS